MVAGVFHVSTENVDSDAIVRVRGDLDIATAPALRDELRSLPPCDRIVVDIADVGFIDSTGLGVIVAALKTARENGRDLVLRSPTHSTRRRLALTGLDTVVGIVDA